MDEEKHSVEKASASKSPTPPPLATPEEERRLVRKLDLRILPITCLLYFCAFLDRSNLGNARLQGLPQETLNGDPTGVLYDWINSAFYFSYILCQVPATVFSKLFPPSYWIATTAIGWGICSTLSASAFNFAGLMCGRLGLGVFEAGFGPGIPLYFSLFYTRTELGLRMGYWFGFAAVAGAFGGLIAFAIQHVHYGPLLKTPGGSGGESDWRVLFLVEGIPAVLLGFITILILPNRPESTKFLTEREREIALERGSRGAKADTGAVVNQAHVLAALVDWRIYTGGVIYFGLNCALASISAFLPTIIKTFGYTNALAQLLTVPPYAVAAIVLCGAAYSTDRFQTRGLVIAGSCFLAAIGYLIVLVVPTNAHARYFAVFCITSGTYTSIGIIIAWFAHNLGSETKRATGIPMFIAIGQGGSILGAHLYPTIDGPRYITGFATTCALNGFGSVLSVVLYLSYKRDNARRDAEHGYTDPDAPVDTRELADKVHSVNHGPGEEGGAEQQEGKKKALDKDSGNDTGTIWPYSGGQDLSK